MTVPGPKNCNQTKEQSLRVALDNTQSIPPRRDGFVLEFVSGLPLSGREQCTMSEMKDPAKLFDLNGKHALITGAGGGIGTALCRGFAACGARIACLDINDHIARSAVNAVEQCGAEGIPVVCDVSQPDQVKQSVEATIERFGQLDILVNLAGRGILKPATEISLQEWEHVINVFLRSTFLFCQAVGKHMIERGAGSIINISSIASLVALGRGVAPYSAAKAGINALTRELAVEWARNGVRVNAIAPCRIRTAPLQDQLNAPATDAEELMASWTDNIPIGRLGEPEEIVGPAIFLASSASSLVTGHVLAVDGGYTIM